MSNVATDTPRGPVKDPCVLGQRHVGAKNLLASLSCEPITQTQRYGTHTLAPLLRLLRPHFTIDQIAPIPLVPELIKVVDYWRWCMALGLAS